MRSIFLLTILLSPSLCLQQSTSIFPGEDWASGFVKIAQGDKALHYYLFRCRDHSIAAPPLLFWMDGGPGYSTAFGVWEHGGPYIVNNSTGLIEWNPYAWNNFSDIVFVDQPAGTLFSYANHEASICTNESCVAKDFYEFLVNFREIRPELNFGRLYIAGVSYAGHYVPAIAAYVVAAQNPNFGLKGVGLFNGLTDLYTQLPAYPQFLYENALIGFFPYLYYEGLTLLCKASVILHLDSYKVPCAILMMTIYGDTGLDKDPSDIEEKYGPSPYEVTLSKYLNLPEIQLALGVNQKFVPMNESVTGALMEDFMLSLLPELSTVLSTGKVNLTMVYGDKDYICNWIGGQWLADAIQWPGRENFLKAQFQPWRDGTVAKFRRHGALTFAIIHGAGHSVFNKQRAVAGEILRALVTASQKRDFSF